MAALEAYRSAGQVLLLILEQGWDAARIREKVALARAALPRAEVVGITHFDGLANGEMPENTLLTFLFFERPAFAVHRLDLAGKGEPEVGRAR